MTGLDVERDAILQIAVIVTDGALEAQAEGPEIAIHQPEEVLQVWRSSHASAVVLLGR